MILVVRHFVPTLVQLLDLVCNVHGRYRRGHSTLKRICCDASNRHFFRLVGKGKSRESGLTENSSKGIAPPVIPLLYSVPIFQQNM